jgi:GlcNAc-P-P-Und epimerase
MKTAIIGGSGFIGSNLMAELYSTTDLINLDKNPSWQFSALTKIVDVRDRAKLEQCIPFGTDSVVLLAAEHRDDVTPVSLYYDVNVTGTQNVIDVCKRKCINTIIFTSSVAVYGLSTMYADEQTPANPLNDYGKSKWQAEQVLQKWQQEEPNARTLIIIRPTVVFGPGNRGNVYNLLKQILSGRFLMIGNGKNKKSLSYIDNVSGFIHFCLSGKFSGYHLFNYADTPDLTVNQLMVFIENYLQKRLTAFRIPYAVGYPAAHCIDILSKIIRRKFAISSVRVKKFCASTQFSSTKMIDTGYVPAVSLKEGLAATLDSILAQSADSHSPVPGSTVYVLQPTDQKISSKSL